MFEQSGRSGFAALVRSVSTAYSALAGEAKIFAPTQVNQKSEKPAIPSESCCGNSLKIRSRQSELIAIIDIVGGTATRLTFLVMRARTAEAVNQYQSDLYTMLARDRGESYANGVIYHGQIAQPQKHNDHSPAISILVEPRSVVNNA